MRLSISKKELEKLDGMEVVVTDEDHHVIGRGKLFYTNDK